MVQLVINKLLALLPLLGWFYVGVIAVATLGWLEKYRGIFFAAIARKSIYLTVVVCSLIGFLRAAQSEYKLALESRERFTKPYTDKIESEAGSAFAAYYRVFRPLLRKNQRVKLVDIDVREYYFARMYLYPASILQSGREALKGGGTFILKNIDQYSESPERLSVLSAADGRYLIHVQPRSEGASQ